MKATNATLADVARHAGVSKTTAAAILRNAPGLRASGKTRERVQEAAAYLGYRRNAIAASLSIGRTQAIGMPLPLYDYEQSGHTRAQHAYAQDLFLAVFKAANRVGLRVIPIPEPAHPGERLSLLAVTDRHIDGLILNACHDADFLNAVEAAGVPCVEIGSDTGVYSVHPDNEAGADAAVAHLAMLGHRRIAHWQGAFLGSAARGRKNGFESAANRFGIITLLSMDAAGTTELLRLPASERPTAFLTFNDHYACTTLMIARTLGLRVPEDLSLIGFDDTILAETAYPPLTTVHNPLQELADSAVALLQARLQGEEPTEPRIVLPTHLVVRGTTTSVPQSFPAGN